MSKSVDMRSLEEIAKLYNHMQILEVAGYDSAHTIKDALTGILLKQAAKRVATGEVTVSFLRVPGLNDTDTMLPPTFIGKGLDPNILDWLPSDIAAVCNGTPQHEVSPPRFYNKEELEDLLQGDSVSLPLDVTLGNHPKTVGELCRTVNRKRKDPAYTFTYNVDEAPEAFCSLEGVFMTVSVGEEKVKLHLGGALSRDGEAVPLHKFLTTCHLKGSDNIRPMENLSNLESFLLYKELKGRETEKGVTRWSDSAQYFPLDAECEYTKETAQLLGSYKDNPLLTVKSLAHYANYLKNSHDHDGEEQGHSYKALQRKEEGALVKALGAFKGVLSDGKSSHPRILSAQSSLISV